MSGQFCENLSRLEEKLGYKFRDPKWLETALKHKSALEGRDGECNDKLEWLGDAVVGLFIADYLFYNYDKPRSWLSLMKSKWASEECLARVARRIDLGSFVKLGKGEEKSGGREKDSIISSTLEAVVGAVFVDSGSYEATKKVLEKIFLKEESLEFLFLPLNYKGLLQRWCLQKMECIPKYEVIQEDKAFPRYLVGVKINGKIVAYGEGPNKKKAEQAAARQAWEALAAENHRPH
jgi:ribonuclease-3